ncbi:TonB-dependent hemoglobin/transferrin/lactoferrin family receptor [Pasteurella sp. PK-2025]|uniref:TonB-dependent hemoglobin/transferrin/lactoferrin family receptor n=1 Tax=Pasteurella sp. PK-2025 TaxID=3413133 RepID=UPI003C71B0D8
MHIAMKTIKFSAITLALLSYCGVSVAEVNNDVTELDTITVSSQQESVSVKEKKVGETVKTSSLLQRQQVQDSRDLVRYDTGVTVVETGRFGSSGYAIRGVDENRVGILIDGLKQAETLSSQGFKELFEGYGNFNNTRNGIEIETVSTATITKGSDSIKSGSGALGGSVIFKTKDARDFLLNKDWHISYKKGYNSANKESLDRITLAGRYKWFDVLFINTKREGQEFKNYYYDIYKSEQEDLDAVGATREKPDPYRIDKNSTLIKFAFQPSENHRFSAALDDSQIESKGADLSYNLRVVQTKVGQSDTFTLGERLNHDKSKRKNVTFSYETFAQTPFWDRLSISYSHQKITNNARTDEYCFKDSCTNVNNPSGLQLKEENGSYVVVDKDGSKIATGARERRKVGYGYATLFKNEKGEYIPEADVFKANVINTLIDCDKLDCTKSYTVFAEKDENYASIYKFQSRPIAIKTAQNGKKYGVIETKSKEGIIPGVLQYEETYFLFPKSVGYARNDYNDRDLNTSTKQINLDLDKSLSFWGSDHQIKYGASYAKSHKSMVNKDGYQGGNVKWWADNFFCLKKIDGTLDSYEARPELYPPITGSCDGRLRSKTGDTFSYLVPVNSKSKTFYFGDNIQLGRYVNLDLNYRYDKVKHLPYYDKNVPVPKGLIAGIFVPLNCNPYGENSDCPYGSETFNANVDANLAIMLKNKTYKHHSYNLGMNIDPLDWLRLQVKYSNGFRAPTSDEVYMTFKHPSFSIQPNPELKAEIAKTKEAAITFHKNNSFITFSGFKTQYRDFIDLVEAGERQVELGSTLKYPFYKNINQDHAKVKGFEVNSHLQLSELSEKLNGFYMGYKFSWQKGKIYTQNEGYIPMNALQPKTSVYSFGYTAPEDKYGIDIYVTDVASKKRDDTYNAYWKDQQKAGNLVQGQQVTDNKLAWRSFGYTIIDAVVHVRPWKNVVLSAGVYNLRNTPYLTWDSARSIRTRGTINLINQNTGEGIKRFYAPGRNYKLSAEITF